MVGPVNLCKWPGCSAHATRASWGCDPHYFALDGKVRGKLAHASPRSSEQPSAYFQRAAAEAQQWIARQADKPAKGKRGGLV